MQGLKLGYISFLTICLLLYRTLSKEYTFKGITKVIKHVVKWRLIWMSVITAPNVLSVMKPIYTELILKPDLNRALEYTLYML